ncbi:MAG: hypothetical protein WC238_00005 [Parcubacteria group bacterium]|jgi:hypothetical protein
MKIYLKDYWDKFDFQTWFLDNILWFILVSVIIVGIARAICIISSAFFISIKLLRQNRDTRGGNGWGKHFADRFIDVWYSKEKTPLRQSTEMYKMNNNPNSRHWIKFIDEELQKKGLIDLLTTSDGNIVKPVRNWKNRIVIFLIESWMVYVVGDNRQYYKNLKQELRKT